MKALAALAAAALALSGCTGGVMRTPGPRIDGMTRTTFHFGATAIGQKRDVDYHRAIGSGLVPAASLQAHLNGIATKLAATAPVSDVPVQVYVRATNIFGAESSADANIYLNYRTLERIESEDEAAAILAHELAHIVLGHPSADIVEDTQARLLNYTQLALAVHGAIARQYGAPGTKEAMMVATGEALLLQLNQSVIGPAWVRQQEEDADLLGLDMLIRAGYEPRAMETSLQKLLEAEKEHIDEHGFTNQVTTLFKERWPELLQAGRDEVVKRVATMAFNSMVEWLKKRHPDTQKRLVLVQQYRERNYAAVALRDPDIMTWHEATRRKDRGTKQIFQSYSDAIEASGRLLKGETPEAVRLAKGAATPEMRDHTFIADAVFRVSSAAGTRKANAAQVFDPPVRGKEPAWLAFRELGFADLADGKSTRGLATLERGYEHLQRPPDAIPSLLFAYERTGQKDKATALASDCASRFPRLNSLGGCKADDPNAKAETQSAARDDDHGSQSQPAWNRWVPGAFRPGP